jgi:hypothetical protein
MKVLRELVGFRRDKTSRIKWAFMESGKHAGEVAGPVSHDVSKGVAIDTSFTA